MRLKAGLTQIDLSELLSVSQGAVGNWETGKREPDYATLRRIADYFHVTTDYLLGRDASVPAQETKTAPAAATEEPAPPDIEAAKVALFGGDGEVTDEMWEEALFAAQLIKERYRRKKDE